MYSEADDYTSNLSKEATLRVALVSRVVVGIPYKRFRNATHLVTPPNGYHSVRTLVVNIAGLIPLLAGCG